MPDITEEAPNSILEPNNTHTTEQVSESVYSIDIPGLGGLALGAAEEDIPTHDGANAESNSGTNENKAEHIRTVDMILADIEEDKYCTNEDAHILIDANRLDALQFNLWAFKGLSVDIAYLLIEVAHISLVARSIYTFSNLTSDIAKKLIAASYSSDVADQLKFFDDLDVETAYQLVNQHYVSEVINNFDKFPDLDQEEFAYNLIGSRLGHLLAADIEKFPTLDRMDIAKRLIESKQTYNVVAYLEKFPDLDVTAVTDQLIKDDDNFTLINNISKFPHLNQADIVDRLFANNQGFLAAENLEQLTEIDHVELANRLIDAGEFKYISIYLDTFKNLTGDIAHRLVKAGHAFEVAVHLNVFSEIEGKTLDYFIGHATIERQKLLSHLFRFKNISEETLNELRGYTNKNWLTEYPRDATNEATKDRWFGAMSYTYLEGGFDKRAIGRIIRLRIEQGVETNIHDASQWLSTFSFPELSLDATSILRNRKRNDFNSDMYESESLDNPTLEAQFFRAIFDAEPELRERLLLSEKDGVAEQMFSLPEARLLYKALLGKDEEGNVFYKKPELSWYKIMKLAMHLSYEYSDKSFGHNKDETLHALSAEELQFRLTDFEPHLYDTKEPISVIVQKLKGMGVRRTEYVRDTERWLLRHATSPHDRLTKVWGDRPLALLEGVPDNAVKIEQWQKVNGLKILTDEYALSGKLAEMGLTPELVNSEINQERIREFSRRLSARDTLEALSKMDRWAKKHGDQNKVLEAGTIPVVIEDVPVSIERPYSFEILSKDDPRGFTIGEDTGCCMTIDGESKSCIKEGYQNPNAGFVALYNPSGDLVAQSFWYVNPEYPDVLVLDNIEANEGRDMNRIVNVYEKALQQYIADHPESSVKYVHIGTGYTDVNIAGLARVDSIPAREGVYSDAEHQVKLI